MEFASLCISLLALVLVGIYVYVSHRSTQIAYTSLHAATNQQIAEQHSIVGPLTPYKVADKESLQIRVFLLLHFHRFNNTTWWWGTKPHINFRKAVTGNSLRDFQHKIEARGGTSDFAKKSVDVLCEIKANEPYFTKRFWNTYFKDFDWSYPNGQ